MRSFVFSEAIGEVALSHRNVSRIENIWLLLLNNKGWMPQADYWHQMIQMALGRNPRGSSILSLKQFLKLQISLTLIESHWYWTGVNAKLQRHLANSNVIFNRPFYISEKWGNNRTKENNTVTSTPGLAVRWRVSMPGCCWGGPSSIFQYLWARTPNLI